MTKTVKLKHGVFAPPKRVVYFYDGLTVAENGLIELPADRRDYVERAWRILGYNCSPSGERLWSISDLDAEIERQTA